MSVYIKELNIEGFRGIQNLTINNLGDVNIVVGGNDSGKTSLLEAIQIITDPSMRVITLVKQDGKTYARNLDRDTALKAKDVYGQELR